jgi:hypothetical protein
MKLLRSVFRHKENTKEGNRDYIISSFLLFDLHLVFLGDDIMKDRWAGDVAFMRNRSAK